MRSPAPADPSNPTGLPTQLFHAVCERNERLISKWAKEAPAHEILQATETITDDPWCALTSRKTVLKAMARYGSAVSPSLLHTCVKDPGLLPALASNETLTSLQIEVIGQHLMASLSDPNWPLASLTEALRRLCEKGYEVPPSQIQKLIAAAWLGDIPAADIGSKRFRVPVEDRRAMRAVHLLARVPQMESPHLAELVGTVKLPKELVRKYLITHPAADRKVWIAALSTGTGAVAKYAPKMLARHVPAARDPEVRGLLKKNANTEVVLSLLQCPQGDGLSLLRRLKQISPLEAARFLADGPDEIRSLAPREMIVDLLQNSDQQVRAAAFRALRGPIGGLEA